MTNRSKAKGDGYEREIHDAHRARAIEVRCERTLLAPQAGKAFVGDLIITTGDGDMITGECKRFKNGLGKLYEAMHGNHLVFARGDRQPTLVVMRFDTYASLVHGGSHHDDSL